MAEKETKLKPLRKAGGGHKRLVKRVRMFCERLSAALFL